MARAARGVEHAGALGETADDELFDAAETLLRAWLVIRVFRFNPFPYLLLTYSQELIPAAWVMTSSAWPALSGDVVLLCERRILRAPLAPTGSIC